MISWRNWRWAAALLLAAPGAANAGGDPPETHSIDIDGRVQMEAPVDVKVAPKQGIDSLVGDIAGDDFVCSYDLGAYSNRLNDIEGASESRLQIDGFDARLIEATPAFIGLHMPEIGRSVIGATRLTISCANPPAGRRDEIETMLRSIRIVKG